MTDTPLCIILTPEVWESVFKGQPTVLIGNITRYLTVEAKLKQWAEPLGVKFSGMFLIFPDTKILELFILQWM